MQICGTDLISATKVLFNGKYSAGLYEWDATPADSADGCWYTTVPIADPPDAVNGPLVIVAPNGVATATTDFTATSFVSSSFNYNRAWLPDGKYYVLTGPYLGTATEVSLDDAPVSFQSANPIRLLIPVSDFDALAHTLAITTPYGVYTNSVAFLEPMLTNMIPPDKDGSFEITGLYYDASVGGTHNAYRTPNGMLLPGNDFMSSYRTYVDTGNTLTPTTLAVSNILVTATLIGPNQVYASGTFTSATTTRTIQWSSVGSIQPNSQEYYVTVTFTDTAGLGALKLRTRLDEDVWELENDMMAMVGTPGEPDFAVMTPDGPVRVGFGTKGVYTTSAGLLENATWDGFAAANYYELDEWIENHSLHYEKMPVPGAYVTGTTANIDLATDSTNDYYCALQQAESGWYSGYVYLTEATDCDMGASMSWTVDPAATTAKVTHILLNVASDPIQSDVAGLDGVVATVAGRSLNFAPTPFISSTLIYTDATPHNGSSVILTPTLSDAQGIVSLVQVTAPGASAAVACTLTPFTCPLEIGVNRIDVTVLSANLQKSRIYRFYITRTAALSTDASLLNLEINPGTLAPAFVSSTTNYTAAVPNGTTSVAVTATTNDAGASVAYASSAGECIPRNTSPSNCALSVGVNLITVTVTAADGTTKQPYTIEIVRAAPAGGSSDASLLNLEINPGTLAPAFVSNTNNYTAEVPAGTTSVMVTATTNDAGASVVYASSAGSCGIPPGRSAIPAPAPGAPCAVAGPKTWITATVTAADESTREYSIEITFAAPPSSDLTIGNVWPKTGVPAGLMPVSLFGSGFTGVFSVTVGGKPLASTNFTVRDDGRIDIREMPAGENFTYVDFVVTGTNGSATAAQAFLYIDLSAGEVPASGGVITTASGATITVPALGSSFVLTYTPVAPPIPPLGNVLMHVFRLDALLNWIPVSEISQPITIELPVDPSVVPNGEWPWLYVFVPAAAGKSDSGKLATNTIHSSSAGMWSLVPGQRYDPATMRVTVRLSRMETYALSTLILRNYYFPRIGPTYAPLNSRK